jgi:hypothetical protein
MPEGLEPYTLSIWSVYDRPDDCPDAYIARRFALFAGDAVATPDFMAHPDLAMLRARLTNAGLYRIPRYEDDDPRVIESWI